MEMWTKVRPLSTVLIAVMVVTLAQARSITNAGLPAISNWYIHVNMDLIRNSEVGRKLALETLIEALDDIEDELHIDIGDEIEAITLLGGELPSSGRHVSDGAVILHGAISTETRGALLSVLQKSGASVTISAENGLDVYRVVNFEANLSNKGENGQHPGLTQGDPEALYYLFGDTQSLITQNRIPMQTFLDANGYLGGLEGIGTDALLVLQADRALMQGGANTTAEVATDWDFPILKNLNAVAIVIAADYDGLQISAQLQADSAEAALLVKDIVEGMVALKSLSDSNGGMGDILRNVQFENEGAVLHVEVPIAVDQVGALKDL